MKSSLAVFILMLSSADGLVQAATDARLYSIVPPEQGLVNNPDAQLQAEIDQIQPNIGPLTSDSVRWFKDTHQLFSINFWPPLPQAPNPDAIQRARSFLDANSQLFGLSREMLDATTPMIEQRDEHGAAVGFHQRFGGIPFVDGQGVLMVAMSPSGIIAANCRRCAVRRPAHIAPNLDLERAFGELRRQLPNLWKTDDGKLSPHDGQTGLATFVSAPLLDPAKATEQQARRETLIQHSGLDFTDELKAHLSFFSDGPQTHLVWEFQMNAVQNPFNQPANGLAIGFFIVLVDAQNGRVLLANVAPESVTEAIGQLSDGAH